jgi:List-Bact-rpt repeat protein
MTLRNVLLLLLAVLPLESLAAGRHSNGTPPQYTVTAEAGAHGTVDPPSQVVEQGSTATIAVTADPGFVIAYVDGGACGAFDNGDGTWTTDQIFADCTVTASFVLSAADVTLQGDFDPDIVEVDDLNLDIDSSILGSSIDWLTGATCHSCPEPDYHFRAASSFPVLGHFYLVFRFPINAPEDDYGVVTDTTGDDAVSIPLASGDSVGPQRTFAFPVSTAGAGAWRSTDGADAYLGFRFLNTNTGRVNYGYAHLVTGASGDPASGFPATIVGYAYNRRGDPIVIP